VRDVQEASRGRPVKRTRGIGCRRGIQDTGINVATAQATPLRSIGIQWCNMERTVGLRVVQQTARLVFDQHGSCHWIDAMRALDPCGRI
jgi:hypothetical protein